MASGDYGNIFSSTVSQTESGRSQEVAAPAQFSAEDIKVPNIPGLTDTFFNKYSGTIDDAREEEPGREPAEALQVPNIPGLTDDFFNKYGVQKPSEEAPIGVYQTEARDIPEPEVPLISADLFDKFIHPVAQGHAPPEVSQSTVYVFSFVGWYTGFGKYSENKWHHLVQADVNAKLSNMNDTI